MFKDTDEELARLASELLKAEEEEEYDEEEYEALVNTVFEVMYNEVMKYDLEVVTWTLMDNWDPCTCSACAQVDAYYGARSGQLVKFCNTLSDMFAARFEQEGLDREISILFLKMKQRILKHKKNLQSKNLLS